jgi:hypothetical protein
MICPIWVICVQKKEAAFVILSRRCVLHDGSRDFSDFHAVTAALQSLKVPFTVWKA